MTFSCDLVSGPLDPTNWFARYGGYGLTPLAANAVGSEVVMTVLSGASNPGADIVSYSPPPFDVVAAYRPIPAVAFADFPLVII